MLRLWAGGVMALALVVPASAGPKEDCTRAPDRQVQIRGCTAIIASNPRAGWAYVNRSHAYERIGRKEKSLADADTAIGLDPTNALAHINRAAALILFKRYQDAIRDTEKAIQLEPDNALAYVNRGYCYEQLGQRENAIADYSRTVALDPKNQYARYALKRFGLGE